MVLNKANNYDLRFNWSKYKETHNQFNIIWKRGDVNRAKFHTKKHPINVYQEKTGDYNVTAPTA